MTVALDRPALLGGVPAVTGPDTTRWPVVTAGDEAAVMEVLRSGALVSDRNEVTAVERLEERWADYVGARHCVGVANGTVALELALESLGVGPGDEVVVPALSFVATAMAVANLGARPVFADVDPVTFNLDPAALEASVTARTVAVVPVHLHGLPADLTAITETCSRHDLAMVEDAAQAHGARVGGRHVGTFGAVGCFSLQATKNLPTCGEGGLVVTDDDALAARLRRLRQFGEVIERGRPRQYVSHELGHNAKLSSVQAAFTLSQLARLDDNDRAQQRQVRRLLDRLSALPGLQGPSLGGPDIHRVWHILRWRIDPSVVGLGRSSAGSVRAAAQRALRAEGVPVTRYQLMPLGDHPAFADLPPSPGQHPVPVTRAVLEDSLTLQRRHLDPSAGPLLDQYGGAFAKVWDNLDLVRGLAGGSGR